jgi:hypothetical protein
MGLKLTLVAGWNCYLSYLNNSETGEHVNVRIHNAH